MQSFKQFFKTFMLTYDLTSVQCADILGIKPGTFYTKISRKTISVDDLLKLAAAVGAEVVIQRKE
jgi:hypothetical protein